MPGWPLPVEPVADRLIVILSLYTPIGQDIKRSHSEYPDSDGSSLEVAPKALIVVALVKGAHRRANMHQVAVVATSNPAKYLRT